MTDSDTVSSWTGGSLLATEPGEGAGAGGDNGSDWGRLWRWKWRQFKFFLFLGFLRENGEYSLRKFWFFEWLKCLAFLHPWIPNLFLKFLQIYPGARAWGCPIVDPPLQAICTMVCLLVTIESSHLEPSLQEKHLRLSLGKANCDWKVLCCPSTCPNISLYFFWYIS